ncbi:hypothetical protein IMZ48_12320 [Candidatus Bathyarchaeota archaeon]|nr:hypothetical protein [Candidatus Bathyarchaeota archaeon]
MRLSTIPRALLLLAPALAAADSADDDPQQCTANAPAGYFDLRPDMDVPPEESRKKAMTADYHANGWDAGYNFTMNICGAVVKPVEDVVGVDEDDWRGVAGYYTYDGSTYSIG